MIGTNLALALIAVLMAAGGTAWITRGRAFRAGRHSQDAAVAERVRVP
ncbi:MAG: hypothetical protein U0Y82_10970 [Thermoleophilia bacterium]